MQQKNSKLTTKRKKSCQYQECNIYDNNCNFVCAHTYSSNNMHAEED